jgi:hypothetical protein
MGLLSDAMGKIGGLLGTEIQGVPIGNFLGIPMDQRQMAIMLATGGDPEKLRQLEMDRMRQELLQRQMSAMDKQQGREDITAAMMQAMSSQTAEAVNRLRGALQSGDEAGAQKAREDLQRLQSPENQLLLRSHIAGHGDMDMALKGGMFLPEPKQYAPPEIVKTLIAANIPPESEEGQAIIRRSLEIQQPAAQQPPSNVQEYEYFKSLSPEQQVKYLEMKRGGNMFDVGGVPNYRQPGGVVQPLATPEEVAGNRGLTRQEEAAGTKVGEAAGQAQVNAPRNASTIEEVRAIASPGGLIEQSTGSGVGTVADAAAGVVGYATEGAKAIARLQPIAHNLLMNVPRFEGPQSNFDVQAYRDAAGKIADPTVPTEVRQAAALEIVRLMEKAQRQQAGSDRWRKAINSKGAVKDWSEL